MNADDRRLKDTLDEARRARDACYVPYSEFRMGAAVLTDRDVLVAGALVENISFGLSMCAERVALFSAVAQSAGAPRVLALVAPRTGEALTYPCGACLQVAVELGGPDLLVAVSDLAGDTALARLAELAPRLPRK